MKVPVIKAGRRVWVDGEDAPPARLAERARKKELSKKLYDGAQTRPDRTK